LCGHLLGHSRAGGPVSRGGWYSVEKERASTLGGGGARRCALLGGHRGFRVDFEVFVRGGTVALCASRARTRMREGVGRGRG
jgi:hypothetical protein